MRKLVALLAGLVVAYVLLDLAAKAFVEGRVEDEFRNGSRISVDEASFTIDSFPFLGRLGAQGEVSATLELGAVEERGVTVDAFTLEVDGLVFDRTSAFAGEVVVTGLDRATTSVSLSEATIGDLIGVPVDIAADGTVTAGEVQAQVALAEGELTLSGDAIGTTTVPVPLARFLPCAPAVEVADELVTLSCVTDALPPVVNRVLGN